MVEAPIPVVLCWSGGKDSAMALHVLRNAPEYDVVALLTTVTRDFDRISMHGVRRALLHRQAAALGLPVDEVWISAGAANSEYEAQMGAVLARYRERGIATVAFGDIFLEDLRTYREENLRRVGMQAIFPIWKRETRALADEFISLGFRSCTCCVDSRKLDESFLGRVIDESFLAALPPDVDPCGENGEFHSFTFAGPIFEQPIPVQSGETVCRDSFLFRDLLPI
jgi:uncharacterized protein (TIGR00290 family)